MRRFFTDPENIADGLARIYEDAVHITKVLRMKENDEIIVFDGSGFEYVAKLESINQNECVARILRKTKSEAEPYVKVVIFQGIPKSGKMETIVQKVVELGAVEIVPVEMERCVVRLDHKGRREKAKRWNKVCVEAAKQCGRGCLPQVLEPVSFNVALEMMKKLDLSLMPYEVLGHEGEKGLKELLRNFDGQSVGILIGPEGGFSDGEASLAESMGINQIGLGKRILRTETVASTIVPIIMYEKDEI